MKQHLVFAMLALILTPAHWLHHTLFPPPPADYRIVYMGSPNCGSCVHWKKNLLPTWKRDPAASTARLELATLNGNAFQGGYGAHDAVFREAFKGRRSISWPSFVVYNHGELDRVYTGLSGWKSLTKKVRQEAARADALAARNQ